MRSYVQILTTPTADTPGTSLMLHFDNKRYLLGSLSEGTQRASVQMGAKLLKVSECFVTGRTEWSNVGGLIGMILTLADSAASSQAASNEEGKKKAIAKGKRLGYFGDAVKMQELEDEARKETTSTLTIFAPPNLNYLLATARKFVFRKGMPVDVHEIDEDRGKQKGDGEWAPYWADENIKIWAMSILPSHKLDAGSTKVAGAISPRKRSIAEVYASETAINGSTLASGTVAAAHDILPEERDQMTVKAVVGEMFNSSWRLDTLYETPLSKVQLPASIFIRDSETNKIRKYPGPFPGGLEPVSDPHKIVLVRRPWPGALVESLPPTQPAKEALSYIIRNHKQRGRFYPDRALALKVEKGFKWAQLSAGQDVENVDGEKITPDMVLGEGKEGGGFAVVDLPDPSYIENLIDRPEWHEQKVMAGVGAIVWICGPGVASDPRLHEFMQQRSHLEHVVSSPEYCPNNIALDSVAASTVRLRQVDPKRYGIPVHSGDTLAETRPLPNNVSIAARGQVLQLEPSMELHSRDAVPALDILEIEGETSKDIFEEAAKAQQAVKADKDGMDKWASILPPDAKDAEIVTLGTGSALPSKYRNVSATLLRVPGWGSMLFDCGENTLGQLKRVFPADELNQVLRELRMIFISHMHADHHLGTVGVITAWYREVHNCQPIPSNVDSKTNFEQKGGLAVVAEPAMLHWLAEYASVEDYGFSHLAPLYITPASLAKGLPGRLGWFTLPSELASLTHAGREARLSAKLVQPSFINLYDIQAAAVQHCHGARAVSITFPSGFKASYSGDCRPSKAFVKIGKGSTICIHEATFDDELQGDALAKNHSTTSEALGVAQAMGARSCVLTHFSQRYQKLPVLDHNGGEAAKTIVGDIPASAADDALDELADPEQAHQGPLSDVASTFPDQPSTTEAQTFDLPAKSTGKSGAPIKDGSSGVAKFRLASDMKVCVAFDYMRVKVGEIAELEKFTPALVKLFADEERPNIERSEGEKRQAKSQKGEGRKRQGKGKN